MNFGQNKTEIATMYSKGPSSENAKANLCSECGKRGHSKEKYWSIIGYLKWHNKNKAVQSQRFASAKGQSGVKMAHNVQDVNESDNVVITTKQLEQLLMMLPSFDTHNQNDSPSVLTSSEIYSPFSGMVFCNTVQRHTNEWIVDSGATDHMTSTLYVLTNVTVVSTQCTIK